jgi:hypothetical protein
MDTIVRGSNRCFGLFVLIMLLVITLCGGGGGWVEDNKTT